mgnify:CR=1 FL=1
MSFTRYHYRRVRADGKVSNTTIRANFVKWFDELTEGDRFFVGHTTWVEAEPDGTVGVVNKKGEVESLPAVRKVRDIPEEGER